MAYGPLDLLLLLLVIVVLLLLFGDDVDFLGDGVDLLGDSVDLLDDVVDLLGDGGNLLGDGGNLLDDGIDLLDDGVDLLGDGGDLLGDGGDQRLEIRKCDQLTYLPTNQLTWVGARDTCVSKKVATAVWERSKFCGGLPIEISGRSPELATYLNHAHLSS